MMMIMMMMMSFWSSVFFVESEPRVSSFLWWSLSLPVLFVGCELSSCVVCSNLVQVMCSCKSMGMRMMDIEHIHRASYRYRYLKCLPFWKEGFRCVLDLDSDIFGHLRTSTDTFLRANFWVRQQEATRAIYNQAPHRRHWLMHFTLQHCFIQNTITLWLLCLCSPPSVTLTLYATRLGYFYLSIFLSCLSKRTWERFPRFWTMP